MSARHLVEDRQSRQSGSGPLQLKLSVIIPVLNEESNLNRLSQSLRLMLALGHEVIIVDGGSRDNTLMIAYEITSQVIVSQAGRSIQMNSGAAIASGDVLLFLHADTALPEDTALTVLGLYEGNSRPQQLWGRFNVRLSGKHFVYRIIERLINLRSCLSSIATGDQAIFIHNQLFERVDGYPEIALMEDIEISARLKKISRAVCVKQAVTTSSRRWEKNGVIRTVLLMWRLRLYYYFGVSPDKLRRLYY